MVLTEDLKQTFFFQNHAPGCYLQQRDSCQALEPCLNESFYNPSSRGGVAASRDVCLFKTWLWQERPCLTGRDGRRE